MTDSSTPRHDELPLPDYDHLPVGGVESRIRSLDADQLATVLAYEKAHGDRLPVVQVLERRLEQLRGGAQPTGGDPTGERPEAPAGAAGGSNASPQTEGPPINPPSQGDPTNPAQPR